MDLMISESLDFNLDSDLEKEDLDLPLWDLSHPPTYLASKHEKSHKWDFSHSNDKLCCDVFRTTISSRKVVCLLFCLLLNGTSAL